MCCLVKQELREIHITMSHFNTSAVFGSTLLTASRVKRMITCYYHEPFIMSYQAYKNAYPVLIPVCFKQTQRAGNPVTIGTS